MRATAGSEHLTRLRAVSFDPAGQRLIYSETRPASALGAKMIKLNKNFETPPD